jgi:FKBP12-rapamycin complex-associated protein
MIVVNHDRNPRPPILTYVLQEANKGMANTSSDVIQGSLLMYRELLLYTNTFMFDHFINVCEKIFEMRTHKVTNCPLLPTLLTRKFRIFLSVRL